MVFRGLGFQVLGVWGGVSGLGFTAYGFRALVIYGNQCQPPSAYWGVVGLLLSGYVWGS